MNAVGEPCDGNRHARFDEGRGETRVMPGAPRLLYKVSGGMGYGLKRDFEDIHYWTGVDWKPRTSIGGVLPVPRGHDRYCTSKPALLWHYLLEAFADPKWTVYDPFSGGGSVGEAAELHGMTIILEGIHPPPVVKTQKQLEIS